MSNGADQLRARWAALAPRERRLVGWAATLVLLALLWWLALAPALRTLTVARTEHARLDAQLQQMSTLAARAQALQGQPKATREDAQRALEASVRQQLGANGQLAGAGPGGGEGVNVLLRGAPADALAQWLAQARGNARALPREAHLTRGQGGSAAGNQPPSPPGTGVAPGNADDASASVRWNGTLVMSLPAR